MELRDRKFIKNTKALPGFEDGVPPFNGDSVENAQWTKGMNTYSDPAVGVSPVGIA